MKNYPACKGKKIGTDLLHQENMDRGNGIARTLKKLSTSKGDYWIKQ